MNLRLLGGIELVEEISELLSKADLYLGRCFMKHDETKRLKQILTSLGKLVSDLGN